MKIKRILMFSSFVAMLVIGASVFFVEKYRGQTVKDMVVPTALARDEEKAVFLYKDNTYEQGGLIEIASTDAPMINIGSIGVSGDAVITTYQASYDDLLKYLIHNDEYEQKNTSVDVSKLSKISETVLQANADNDSSLPLSIGENGIWFVQANLQGVIGEAFVIRTDVGAIASEGDNEIIIWSQNFKTKKSIPGASVAVYNLNGRIQQIESTTADHEGIAKVRATQDADIAIIESDGKKAVLPLNYKYLNINNYTSYQKKTLENEYFVFTDRPLYRPGDKVNFKAIIRQEDDAVFTVATGKVHVKIIKGYDDSAIIAQQNFTISEKGAIDGEFNLPADAEVGSYTLVVTSKDSEGFWGNNSISFDVEEFVKPEYSIEATSRDSILIAGDTMNIDVHGGYFSGQPLAGEEIKYTISSSPYSDYGYRDEFDPNLKWRWSWGGSTVHEGSVILNDAGDGSISFKMPNTKEGESSNVYVIQVEYVNEGGRSSLSTVNVLVKSGEFGIYKKDYSWGSQVNKSIAMPFVLTDIAGKTVPASIPIKIKTKWSYWEEVREDGKTKYELKSEDFPEQNINSENGEFSYSFTPSRIGLYDVTVSASDPRGNVVENTYSMWAYSEEEYARFGEYGQGSLGIDVQTDKEKYNPGDEAKIIILSKELDRDALLTMERGRTRRYSVVHLKDTQTTLIEKIQNDDIPNIFATVSTFGSRDIDTDSANLLVSTASKKISVDIKPDRSIYGPGDMAVVDISTTDSSGKPVSTDTAVWAIDKALYELVDSNMQSIFDTFWHQRGNSTSGAHSLQGISSYGAESGGCFGEGTRILMADKTTKNIEDIQVGDHIATYKNNEGDEIVDATVLKTEDVIENGFLVINEKLKVTPNHVLWVNGDWRQAGIIQIGDSLKGIDGDEKVYSIEWKREKVHVYNLEIENQHTFIAENVWVHNGKGDSMRVDLEDTAYWNPSVQTDSRGHAKISFKLPDNLTTWVIATVAATDDTRVGHQTADIVVSKNITVRPMLPNVLQEGDEVIVGSLVQNFSDNDQKMKVEAVFDSGVIDNSVQSVDIAKGESVKVYWRVSPQVVNERAKFSVEAIAMDTTELRDGIVVEIPVKKFGFPEVSGTSMVNDGQFPMNIPQDAFNEKSSVKVEISASLVGSLSSAMDYLLQYPYGCVEQTTSSFVPAIISKQNKDLFQFKKTDISVDDVADKGIARLKNLQNQNGGWGWWGQDQTTNPFITAYVAEYLLKAKELGYALDEDMYSNMLSYLKSFPDEALTPYERRIERIGKTYGLSIIEKGVYPDRLIKNFFELSPDQLALVVMANIHNGNTNPADNGLNALIALAKNSSESVYWEAGDIQYFGGKDVSTAFALRALIAGRGNPDLINKAVKYLTQGRKESSWQNTFATAQVLQALVDWARLNKVTSTQSSYTLLVDGQQIAQGKFNDYRQIEQITIPIDQLKKSGSNISLKKDGQSDVYTTLVATLFRTDKNSKPLDKGFSITRSYAPEGARVGSTLAVGDVVNVTLAVKSDFDEKYVVIEDHLPSGLIPINPKFKNEQASGGGESAQTTMVNGKRRRIDNREVTKDGMIISVENISKGTTKFTYRARVVSQGEFSVIPAVITKMYAPDVYGRTSVQKITVQKERPAVVPRSVVREQDDFSSDYIFVVVVALLFAGGSYGFYLWRKRRGTLK